MAERMKTDIDEREAEEIVAAKKIKEAQSQFDWAGVIFGVVVALLGFGGAYWAWPAGVMDRPISGLTVWEALRIAASALIGFVVGVGGVVSAIRDANEPFR